MQLVLLKLQDLTSANMIMIVIAIAENFTLLCRPIRILQFGQYIVHNLHVYVSTLYYMLYRKPYLFLSVCSL